MGPLEQTTIDRWPLSSGWSQSGKVLVLAVAAALVLSGLFLAVPFFFPLFGGFLLALIRWRTFPLTEVETDGRVLFVLSLRKRAEDSLTDVQEVRLGFRLARPRGRCTGAGGRPGEMRSAPVEAGGWRAVGAVPGRRSPWPRTVAGCRACPADSRRRSCCSPNATEGQIGTVASRGDVARSRSAFQNVSRTRPGKPFSQRRTGWSIAKCQRLLI